MGYVSTSFQICLAPAVLGRLAFGSCIAENICTFYSLTSVSVLGVQRGGLQVGAEQKNRSQGLRRVLSGTHCPRHPHRLTTDAEVFLVHFLVGGGVYERVTFSLLVHCSGRGQGRGLQSHGSLSPERMSPALCPICDHSRLPAYQVGMPFGRSRCPPQRSKAFHADVTLSDPTAG